MAQTPTLTGVVAVFAVLAGVECLFALMWWRLFDKAGHLPSHSLIPVFNLAVLLQIAGRPTWWAGLTLFPVVNLVWFALSFPTSLGVARAFNKGRAFALGLAVLPILFYPLLSFGAAKHCRP